MDEIVKVAENKRFNGLTIAAHVLLNLHLVYGSRRAILISTGGHREISASIRFAIFFKTTSYGPLTDL